MDGSEVHCILHLKWIHRVHHVERHLIEEQLQNSGIIELLLDIFVHDCVFLIIELWNL